MISSRRAPSNPSLRGDRPAVREHFPQSGTFAGALSPLAKPLGQCIKREVQGMEDACMPHGGESPPLRPASQVVKVPSGRASISSVGSPPSTANHARAAVPATRLAGAAPNIQEPSAIEALGQWLLERAGTHWTTGAPNPATTTGAQDSRCDCLSPDVGNRAYSALDHIIHGLCAGTLIGCAFYWALLRG